MGIMEGVVSATAPPQLRALLSLALQKAVTSAAERH